MRPTQIAGLLVLFFTVHGTIDLVAAKYGFVSLYAVNAVISYLIATRICYSYIDAYTVVSEATDRAKRAFAIAAKHNIPMGEFENVVVSHNGYSS